MKKRNFITLMFAVISSASFASERPTVCFSIESIKQVDLNYIVVGKDETGKETWAASQKKHKYNTDFEWTFVLGGKTEKVKDKNEAHEKAWRLLQTIKFEAGPFYGQDGSTACLYKANEIDISSMAITPALNMPINLSS